jgi:hypothetical protein
MGTPVFFWLILSLLLPAGASAVDAPGHDTVWISLIVAASGMASPLLLSGLTNRQRKLERQEDYARQDQVAAKAREAAELLVESNRHVAESSAKIQTQLGQIHVLVNSNMTTAMKNELAARKDSYALLNEAVDLKRAAGAEPSITTLDQISIAGVQIAELEAQLADRLKTERIVAQAQALDTAAPALPVSKPSATVQPKNKKDS